jgi:hypothetical protein
MKSSSSLIFISLLASQALACIHFEGTIQQGGVNHGISIIKFEDNGSKPCQGNAYKNNDGSFRIDCIKGVQLEISPKGNHVKYSYGTAHFEWDQKVTTGKGDSFGACDDRRGACVTVGKTYDWNTKMYC